jgi:hypothetical protein
MIPWNFDLSSAPRDGRHVLMATTNGKRFLTRWIEPNKFTPNGRWDGFPENAKTLLAWCGVPDHPDHESPRKAAEAGSESDGDAVGRPTSERQPKTVGSEDGGVTGGESAATISADEAERMGHYTTRGGGLITHKHIFLDDCGSGA